MAIKHSKSNIPSRNPNWTRDELILALDLYFRMKSNRMVKNDARIIELSELLRALPIHSDLDIPEKDKFRNPNGVSMKLNNIKGVDPNTPGGLRVDKGVKAIWKEFSQNRDELHLNANSIKKNIHLDSYEKSKTNIEKEYNMNNLKYS